MTKMNMIRLIIGVVVYMGVGMVPMKAQAESPELILSHFLEEGEMYYQMGEVQKSWQAFHKAHLLSPGDVHVQQRLWELKGGQGQYPSSLQVTLAWTDPMTVYQEQMAAAQREALEVEKSTKKLREQWALIVDVQTVKMKDLQGRIDQLEDLLMTQQDHFDQDWGDMQAFYEEKIQDIQQEVQQAQRQKTGSIQNVRHVRSKENDHEVAERAQEAHYIKALERHLAARSEHLENLKDQLVEAQILLTGNQLNFLGHLEKSEALFDEMQRYQKQVIEQQEELLFR